VIGTNQALSSTSGFGTRNSESPSPKTCRSEGSVAGDLVAATRVAAAYFAYSHSAFVDPNNAVFSDVRAFVPQACGGTSQTWALSRTLCFPRMTSPTTRETRMSAHCISCASQAKSHGVNVRFGVSFVTLWAWPPLGPGLLAMR